MYRDDGPQVADVGTLNACAQLNRSIFWDSLGAVVAGAESSTGADLG